MTPAREVPVLWRNASTLEVSIGGDLVLYRPDTGYFCDVNDTGKAIWEMLASPRTLPEIVTAIGQCFAVDSATCERDIAPFLNTLLKSDFILEKCSLS
jgi:coenzyme PQQ synthesis protein D (PqqD)